MPVQETLKFVGIPIRSRPLKVGDVRVLEVIDASIVSTLPAIEPSKELEVTGPDEVKVSTRGIGKDIVYKDSAIKARSHGILFRRHYSYK